MKGRTQAFLSTVLKDWSFKSVDSEGRSRCNITCWKDTMDLINASLLLAGIRSDPKSKELGKEFSIITLYGPYDDREAF